MSHRGNVILGIYGMWNGHPSRDLPVIGVTGTEGKSTTVYLIYQLLHLAGLRAGFFSTVMSDSGRGEELRMSNGNIYLTCPGDIVEQPGRDKVSLAPRHNIMKANRGFAEVTSGQGVTVASEGNVQVCAASAGFAATCSTSAVPWARSFV